MSSAAIQAMLDDVYATSGVAIQWTPSGGSPVALTGLLGGGDVVAQFHGAPMQMNMATRWVKIRVAELAVQAPGLSPRSADAVAILDDAGNVTDSLVIAGDPRREDPRRLEWTLDLVGG